MGLVQLSGIGPILSRKVDRYSEAIRKGCNSGILPESEEQAGLCWVGCLFFPSHQLRYPPAAPSALRTAREGGALPDFFTVIYFESKPFVRRLI